MLLHITVLDPTVLYTPTSSQTSLPDKYIQCSIKQNSLLNSRTEWRYFAKLIQNGSLMEPLYYYNYYDFIIIIIISFLLSIKKFVHPPTMVGDASCFRLDSEVIYITEDAIQPCAVSRITERRKALEKRATNLETLSKTQMLVEFTIIRNN